MSLPAAPIPWRLWPVLALCAAFAWAMMQHAFRRQDRKRNNDHD